jgi:hypothetical protein
MSHCRDAARFDGAEIDECRRRCRLGRMGVDSGQLGTPAMEAGRRHCFIPAEGSNALAALRMPKQAATPGCFL